MSPRAVPTILVLLFLTSCTPKWQNGRKTQDVTNLPGTPAPIDNSSAVVGAEANGRGTKAEILGPAINTPGDDLAPFRYGDRLYFSSAKLDARFKNLHHVLSSVNQATATPWPENSKEAGVATSNLTLSPDGRKVFFTFCEEKAPGRTTCEIYTRERAFEGHWLPFKRLPRSVNQEGYTSTQPTVGYNRALRKDVLYYASNRPGGKGGMDIWYAPIERNGTFGAPVLLPFNTPAEEVTPFFHQQNQVLYFSSNVAADSTGFDIYKTANTWSGVGDSHWSPPVRLEKPFNSQYDDEYFTWHSGSGKAYFSSNRPGGTDFNIYEAAVQTELVAQLFDASDSTSVMGGKLQLYEVSSTKAAALPGYVDGTKTKFFIETDKKYKLITSAIGFLPDTVEFSANEADIFETLRQPIYLKPKARLLVRTFNAIDSLPLGGVALQLGQAGELGDKMLVTNKDDEYQHAFLVSVGDVVSLVAMKPGFVTTYVRPNAERRFLSSPDAHVDIYLSPFTEAPVALYFDNDEPKWVKPKDTETKLTYEQTLDTYLERKQVFLEKYVEGLPAEAADMAKVQVSSFFDEEIRSNFERLDRLCRQLKVYLDKGYELELLAVGEASPLASNDYNERLISRRISSVINQLEVWDNGALKKYLDSEQLIISSEMKIMEDEGEKVRVKLSTDRRQLEFSPEASKMRKVLIEGVKRQKGKA